MEITKIIGIALVGVCTSLFLKQYQPEFAIFISLVCGCMILVYVFHKLSFIVNLLKSLASRIDLNEDFLVILLKATGIAYVTEFACNTCRDAGETAIASKVELAGRVLIASMAIPIITTLVEMMQKLIPASN